MCIRDSVDAAIGRARALAPDEVDVLLAAAGLSRIQARLARVAEVQAKAEGKTGEEEKARADAAAKVADARNLLNTAMGKEQGRKAPRAYLLLAGIEADVRQLSDAIAVLERGLAELPDSTDLLVALSEYQFQTGDRAGLAKTLEKLRATDGATSPGVAEYQQARVFALEEDWGKAAAVLGKAIPLMAASPHRDSPNRAREANLLLARCYEQLGRHANRFAAYDAALNNPKPLDRADPLWGQATFGIAEAQEALGRTDDALATFRTLAATRPGVWPTVARLELRRALSAPGGQRNWKPTEEALAMAEIVAQRKLIPDDLKVRLLRATLLRYQGRTDAAKQLVEELRKARPKEAAVWVELAALQANPRDGLATLDAAEKEAGDSVELRLARAALLAAAGEPNLADKLAALAAGGKEKFGVAQHRQLLRGLAQTATRAGADAAAGSLLEALAAEKSFDLTVHLDRFDHAARANDIDRMKAARADVARIDGEGGPYTRLAEAFIKMQEGKDAGAVGPRAQALAILEALEREQVGPPLLDRVLLAQAVVHRANGNRDAAREKFRQASLQGSLGARATVQYLELLVQSGDEDDAKEANRLIEQLKRASELTPEVSRLAANNLWADNPKAALEYAEKAVAKDSKNYRDQIWLGRMKFLGTPAERSDAAVHFRQATALAPEEMEAWLTLMGYLIAEGDRPAAEKVFEEGKGKVREADRLLFAADGHTLLGQPEKALEAVKQARLANPSDPRAALAEGEFLLRGGKLLEAREAFERAAALPGATEAQRATARTRAITAVALAPDHADARKAVEMLKATPPAANETPAQRRARAVIYAVQRDAESKRQAVRLLADNPQGRTPNETFLLAQLHNALGEGTQVQAVMVELLRSEKNRTPMFVGFYALWLVRNSQFVEAEKWIDVLEKGEGNSLRVAELKARLAKARKDRAATAAALRAHVNDPKAPAAALSRLCEELELYDEAEALLKRAVEEEKEKTPATVLALAAYYGRRKDSAKAFRIWDEWRDKLPAPAVGGTAVAILSNATEPSPGELERVAKWIDDAARKAAPAERAALLQQLAAVRNLQVDYSASMEMYQKALADNPRDVLAMNNLAYLTAARNENYPRAIELIEGAKRVVGENPEVRDTEALVRYLEGRHAEAQRILRAVVVEAPSGTAFFHLALAEDALGNTDEARDAWKRSGELGLGRGDLHPLERKDYDRMATKYNAK